MNSNITDKKTEFKRLIASILQSVSSSDENACGYLKDEGLDPDEILNDGLKRIKYLQFRLAKLKNTSVSKKDEKKIKNPKLNEEILKKNIVTDDNTEFDPEYLINKKIIINEISNLKLQYREVMYFRYCEGLSFDEISKRMNLNVNTLKKRAKKGLEELRKNYGKL
jgi:RNA polymerase sigma factor (sigma-70 family)